MPISVNNHENGLRLICHGEGENPEKILFIAIIFPEAISRLWEIASTTFINPNN